MRNTGSDYGKGLTLAACGGLLLSLDIPFIRLAEGEPWSVMLLRSLMILAIGLAYAGFRALRAGSIANIVPGRAGIATAALYGLTTAAFLSAVYTTSTASLVFILAINPMFAAVLAWVFLDERPSRATLITMVIMMLGVLIIVHDGLGAGLLLGNMLALVASLAIAGAITVTRASGQDMSATPLLGTLIPLALAAAVTAQHGVRVDAPLWLAVNGLVIIPIAFFCLARAPHYLPGPEVAMFYLLETVLAPIWVWIFFREVPTLQTVIGGAVLLTALLVHALWQLRQERRRRRDRIR